MSRGLITRRAKWSLAVAAFCFVVSAGPAVGSTTVVPSSFSDSLVSTSAPGCNNSCDVTFSDGGALSFNAYYVSECELLPCGEIDGGSVDFSSSTFSFDGIFLSGIFHVIEDGCNVSEVGFFDDSVSGYVAITALNGQSGAGSAEFDFGETPVCNGDQIVAATLAVSFSNISFTPTPEPSSLLLLATGLLGFGPFIRRRVARA